MRGILGVATATALLAVLPAAAAAKNRCCFRVDVTASTTLSHKMERGPGGSSESSYKATAQWRSAGLYGYREYRGADLVVIAKSAEDYEDQVTGSRTEYPPPPEFPSDPYRPPETEPCNRVRSTGGWKESGIGLDLWGTVRAPELLVKSAARKLKSAGGCPDDVADAWLYHSEIGQGPDAFTPASPSRSRFLKGRRFRTSNAWPIGHGADGDKYEHSTDGSSEVKASFRWFPQSRLAGEKRKILRLLR